MIQRHRIFIAINLPQKIKKKLVDYQNKCPELPVKWTRENNIHITLFFLGYVDNDSLSEICTNIKEIGLRHSSFCINLNKICYGPTNKIPPKMIWAVGEKNKELLNLIADLEKILFLTEQNNHFSLHITLGRIRQMEWRRVEPEERPEVEQDINLKFEVNSIEVMESELRKAGPEYTILESITLKD